MGFEIAIWARFNGCCSCVAKSKFGSILAYLVRAAFPALTSVAWHTALGDRVGSIGSKPFYQHRSNSTGIENAAGSQGGLGLGERKAPVATGLNVNSHIGKRYGEKATQ